LIDSGEDILDANLSFPPPFSRMHIAIDPGRPILVGIVSFWLKYEVWGEFGLPVKGSDTFNDVPVVELQSLAPDCNVTSAEFRTAGKRIDNLVEFI
jgi:hypothetical protein